MLVSSISTRDFLVTLYLSTSLHQGQSTLICRFSILARKPSIRCRVIASFIREKSWKEALVCFGSIWIRCFSKIQSPSCQEALNSLPLMTSSTMTFQNRKQGTYVAVWFSFGQPGTLGTFCINGMRSVPWMSSPINLLWIACGMKLTGSNGCIGTLCQGSCFPQVNWSRRLTTHLKQATHTNQRCSLYSYMQIIGKERTKSDYSWRNDPLGKYQRNKNTLHVIVHPRKHDSVHVWYHVDLTCSVLVVLSRTMW